MLVRIIGYKNVNFEGKEGKRICGTSIYIAGKKRGYEGEVCEKVFIGDQLANECQFIPSVGAEIEIEYNSYGKIQNIYNT